VPDRENHRSLTGWVSRLSASLRGTANAGDVEPAPDGEIHLSRALPKFFAMMRSREAPVLLDLGPVVGENVTMLGELLGCKLHIENVFGGINRQASDRRAIENCAEVPTQFSHPDNSIDGVLCWDVLDYLSQAAAAALVAELTRMLKPGGVGMAIFSTIRPDAQQYRKYIMQDQQHLRHRTFSASQGAHRLWTSRDVQLVLKHLEVDESFLLTHRQRETLFHKPLSAGVR
jgi:predicted SAM-dependent methyltransferase